MQCLGHGKTFRFSGQGPPLFNTRHTSNQGMVWNEREISVWNKEDARMKYRRMEDFKNGMEDNLPYFHTNSIAYWYFTTGRFRTWHFTEKYVQIVIL